MKPFWTNTEGENLAQGDFLPGCHVPAFGEAFGIEGAEQEIAVNRWETVRKGQQPGLHLLASPETPEDNRAALVVDFGEIHSLPPSYVKRHAAKMGSRWRLESPFLEHFSRALAR